MVQVQSCFTEVDYRSQLLLSAHNCRRYYMGLARSRFSSFTVHWIRQEPMISERLASFTVHWIRQEPMISSEFYRTLDPTGTNDH
jgi:hypothetical protein